jgi:amino acid transporter/mannitol/fructose-specific phosphotransferase system IIA component (Ntr-type)
VRGDAVGAPRLDKELGLYDVYAISTGAMFSSGFFLLPGLAAAQTGPSVALAYLVAGVFILPAMLSVAELSTAMPRAGGAYYFLDRALGPMVGTVGGLGTWLALVLKSAFALVGMGAYLAIYLDVPIEPLAITLTLVFMAINVVGAKESSGLQRWLVTVLVAILGVFIVLGLFEVGGRGFGAVTVDRFTPFLAFGLTGFMSTVGFVFVSYAGLTKVASVSEEVRDPDRNIPLGMTLSLLTATAVYTVGVYILVAVLPPDDLRADLTPVATAAAEFFDGGDFTGIAVAAIVVAAVAAFASTGNAGILSASRYPLAMARDRLVPESFGALGRFRTPTRSIIVTGGLMIAAIVFLDVASIAKLASAFQLALFSLLCLAVVIMRESGIDGYDPGFRSPFYPWMQVVGIVAPIWLVAEMGQLAILFTVGLLGATLGWYLWYARHRVQRSGAIFHTFARLGTLRYGGLDKELRMIVAEKGLREEDPFDTIVASAPVLRVEGPASLAELVGRAAQALAEQAASDADTLQVRFLEEIEGGFAPIAKGVAIPHLRIAGLHRPWLLLARCQQGIEIVHAGSESSAAEFRSLRAVFFLLSPEADPGRHLRMLGHLAAVVDEPDFARRWREASSDEELRGTLIRGDRIMTVRVGHAHPGEVGMPAWAGRHLRDLRLPEGTLVALVDRGGRSIVPSGSTRLDDDDLITIIGEPAALDALMERMVPGMEMLPG